MSARSKVVMPISSAAVMAAAAVSMSAGRYGRVSQPPPSPIQPYIIVDVCIGDPFMMARNDACP
jgi:hypothetical protein